VILNRQMIQFIDRCFLKQPLLRRFVTRVLAGTKEEKVVLLALKLQVHTAREHGYFRTSKLSQTCSLLQDELPVPLHIAGLLEDGDMPFSMSERSSEFLCEFRKFSPHLPKFTGVRLWAKSGYGRAVASERATARGKGVFPCTCRPQRISRIYRRRRVQRF